MKKFVFNNPIETEAVILPIPASEGMPEFGEIICDQESFTFTYKLDQDTIVYGLGESVRGINKRGWEYISYAIDDPHHQEDTKSLYGAHNFLIIDGKEKFGLFIDQPGKVIFDIGYHNQNILSISCAPNLNLYVLSGSSAYDIAKQFRSIIGQSYKAPKFAFGYGQSRWGYKKKEDFLDIVQNFEKYDLPIDLLYMDIDYMDHYKDFTLNQEEFHHDFSDFVLWMKEKNIHLVPIIDAAIKKEKGYKVYDEGVQNNYFCKLADHTTDFVGAVWPGYSVFPDFLNQQASTWFGLQYAHLIKQGIDAFWNDMNEPAIFYSKYGMESLKTYLNAFLSYDGDDVPYFKLCYEVEKLKNANKDYKMFYHHYKGQWIRHDLVHNLYGYFMTRSAAEAFRKLRPGLRTLLFSRSSYIGMHRYGGIWTGDNKSWWSHILLLLHQLPALSMCGFLYSGADLGGFGSDTTRDLALRFLQIGLFTPLMRNHSALGTRLQEPYAFEDPSDFAHILKVRYQLIPYLYSEYLKAIENNDLLFKPLGFEFDDPISRTIEDQLLLGNELMIAPIYTQNAIGRPVYLPEEMLKVVFKKDGSIETEELSSGWHFVYYGLNEVLFFIRNGCSIPIAPKANRVNLLDYSSLTLLGYPKSIYKLWDDDGITTKNSLKVEKLSI